MLQRKRVQRSVLLSCSLLVLLGVLPGHAQKGPPPALVQVAPVMQRSITQPVMFVGTVEPPRRSLIASEVAGLVQRVHVDAGQAVQQGEVLVQLSQERLRFTLRERQAAAERFRQELAELKNGARPEEIDSARAAMMEAEAELEGAMREKKRQTELRQRGVAPRQMQEDAETSASAARQRVMRTRALYKLVVRGPRSERIAQAAAQYSAAQAEVARLQYDIRRSRVEAPFAGFVIKKHTEVGQWLRPGDAVVELIDLSRAHIVVPVPERYILQVQLGTAAPVKFDALPDTTWEGKIIYVVPQATESRTFPVTIEVVNSQAQIKSGFFARVTLTVGEQQNVLLVPKDAVIKQGPRDIVYAVRDRKATPVPVQQLSFHEGFAVIKGALQPEEQVVIRGNERLRPGQPVRIQGTKAAR